MGILKGRERAYVKSKYEEDVLVGNHTSTWGSWYDSVSGRWGFACCRQTMKNAYCTPLKKLDAVADSIVNDEPTAALTIGQAEKAGSSSSDSDASSSGAEGGAEDVPAEKRRQAIAEKRRARALKGIKAYSQDKVATDATGSAKASSSASGAVGSGDSSRLTDQRTSAFGHVLEEIADLDNAKVTEAVDRERKRQKTEKQASTIDDERSRTYNSVQENNVGEVTAEEFEAYRLTRIRSDDPMAQFT